MSEVNQNQPIETAAYIPTYRLKPEFKEAVLKAIGQYPFNQINPLLTAISVDVMDQNMLGQVMSGLSNFPYIVIAPVLQNVNSFIELIQPE